MDWNVHATPVAAEDFQVIEPKEVLYDFDGPRIFTADTSLGELLFYLADEQDGTCRYVAAPTNPRLVEKLKTGVHSVRQALDQPWIWVADLRYDGTPVAAWKGTLADVPNDALPKPGIMLWPELEPVFVLRAIGGDIEVALRLIPAIRIPYPGQSRYVAFPLSLWERVGVRVSKHGIPSN